MDDKLRNGYPTMPPGDCAGCPAHNRGALLKLGIKMADWDYVVALAGNPNTGKSTLFNALTGLRQHTGNWPGKTVGRAEGGFNYDGASYKLIDLPGTYSLLSTSYDEEIARDFILFGQPDVTVVVVDATRLERNLNLALQVLEITERVVICLNLIDEAGRLGLSISHQRLSNDLGVPVVPTSARSRRGLQRLLQAMADIASGRIQPRPHRLRSDSAEINGALTKITGLLEKRFPGLPNARWVALRLLDGDDRIVQAVSNGELGGISRLHLENGMGEGRRAAEAAQ